MGIVPWLLIAVIWVCVVPTVFEVEGQGAMVPRTTLKVENYLLYWQQSRKHSWWHESMIFPAVKVGNSWKSLANHSWVLLIHNNYRLNVININWTRETQKSINKNMESFHLLLICCLIDLQIALGTFHSEK